MVFFMRSIQNNIVRRIHGKGRGWVFTPVSFSDLGSRDAIKKALGRLKAAGEIRRLTRGVYDYPRVHPVLGERSANYKDIAQALAGKNGLRIQPSGAYAANLLGLTEQVPVKMVFLTDGANQTLAVGNKKIVLKRTTPKNMATANRISGLVIQALRYLGKEHIDDKIMGQLSRQISAKDKKQLMKDIHYAPAWIADIFRALSGKGIK